MMFLLGSDAEAKACGRNRGAIWKGRTIQSRPFPLVSPPTSPRRPRTLHDGHPSSLRRRMSRAVTGRRPCLIGLPSCGRDSCPSQRRPRRATGPVHTLIAEPTADIVAHADRPELAALMPWMVKIDWMLELVFYTLGDMATHRLSIPRLTDVNLSGSGICFQTSRRLDPGDVLAVELILPPFSRFGHLRKSSGSLPLRMRDISTPSRLAFWR